VDYNGVSCAVASGTPFVVRAKSCFTLWSFSLIRKTELWKTNKPPAKPVVVIYGDEEMQSAYKTTPFRLSTGWVKAL